MDFKDFIIKEVNLMLRTECSPPVEINSRLLHGILGIADEAGEIVKIAKSKIYYDKPIDITNLIEELGDNWWYFRLLIDEIAKLENTTVEKVFLRICKTNELKLAKRYKDEYSNKQALNRNLFEERTALETKD